VAEFTSDIQHIKGEENVVADTLSRTPPPPSRPPDIAPSPLAAVTNVQGRLQEQLGLDFAAVAARQQQCPTVHLLVTSSSLKVRYLPVGGQLLLCDFSTGSARPLIPAADRRNVFELLHGLAHPGIRATRRLLSKRVVWKGMATDAARWCRDCQQCQRVKVTAQPAAAVQPIPVPSTRFSHIHADIVGPLPVSALGYNYILTVMDCSKRWLEAVPMRGMEAATCADALVAGSISRFGVPAVLTTDRGTQFSSALWSLLCQRLGIRHVMTTSYHPQSNGLVERAHRQMKEALKARLAGDKWPDHLPWVLLGIRAAPKDNSNISAAEATLGTPLTLPGQLLTAAEQPVGRFVEQLRSAPPIATRTLPVSESASKIPPPAVFSFSRLHSPRGRPAAIGAAVCWAVRCYRPVRVFYSVDW
jgi:transposase InsO family protein